MTHDEEFQPTVLTATMKGTLSAMGPNDANMMFSKVISDIALGCVEKGAVMIGHIKANFVTEDGLLSVSCTTNDGATRCRSTFGKNVGAYKGTFNVIVFGTDYDDMKSIVTKVLDSIPGEKCYKIIENEDSCTDPDCHDPNCHDHGHRHFIEIK